MIKFGSESVSNMVADRFVSCMHNQYETLVMLNKVSPECEMKDYVALVLLQNIAQFAILCEHVPEYLTQEDMHNIARGRGSHKEHTLLLRDPVVHTGLLNLRQPINCEAVYQILFDRDYRYIPPEQRPKDDFMNKPE